MRYLPIIVVALLTIYCVVEVAQADGARVRLAPKWLWAAAVIALPLVGAVAWLMLGRPVAERPGDGGSPATDRPKGPDDDETFLRGL